MQEQFEQAYSEDHGGMPMAFIKLQRLGDSYGVPKIARAWYWFKRSRLVITLPETKEPAYWESFDDVEGQCFNWAAYNRDVLLAINS
jgi:hypothetical protein